MLLRSSSALSVISPSSDSSMAVELRWRSATLARSLRMPKACRPAAGAMAAARGAGSRELTGVVFEPFKEVQHELALVPSSPEKSLARQKFSSDCEIAINEQISVEYNVSYVYHALFAYFDRDNVALRGMAKLFKDSSDEEREHAEKLMKYQNKRGGRVKLQSILMPLTEFDHEEKGDALYAMELALSLERLVNEKLLNLHSVRILLLPSFLANFWKELCSHEAALNKQVAVRCNDPQMTEYIESEFLGEQVEAIKKLSEYVAQLRRVGRGHGVWHFDQKLLHEVENGAA